MELFLLVPLDAILMFFCLQKRNNILLYVMIATLASSISAGTGYLIGYFLWDMIGHWVVPNLISTGTFANLSGHLQAYEHWGVFFCSFIPFPLKALSLAAGVFNLGLLTFVTWVAAGRLVRFALVGGVVAVCGEKVKLFVDRHFHRIFMLIGAKTAFALIFFWALAK